MAEDQKQRLSGLDEVAKGRKVYPDAKAIFTTKLPPLSQIKDECLFVLDTNTLLVPYQIGPKGLGEIARTYEKLVKSDRLVVPGQAAREFAKHRATKLGELYQRLNRRRQIENLSEGRYPLLEGNAKYDRVLELETQIDELHAKYRESIGEVMQIVTSWQWDDPVSQIYSRLLGGAVFDPPLDDKQLASDYEWRMAWRIPPGFKDDAPGDVIIWHTILKLGQDRKKHVVFVSHDEKTDWYHQSERKGLYPRFELVDEYRRASGGASFHMMRLSAFLDLFDVSSEVVAEVKREEPMAPSAVAERSGVPAALAWANTQWPNAQIRVSLGFPGLFVRSGSSSDPVGVEAKVYGSRIDSGDLEAAFDRGCRLIRTGALSGFVLFVAADSELRAQMLRIQMQRGQYAISATRAVVLAAKDPGTDRYRYEVYGGGAILAGGSQQAGGESDGV